MTETGGSEISNEEKRGFQIEAFERLARPAFDSMRIVYYLRDHPFCSNEELRQASGLDESRRRNEFPELVYLAGEVLSIRLRLRLTYQALSSETASDGERIAEVLYAAARSTKGEYKPVEPLEISRLDDPFALHLLVCAHDFKLLHSRDSGGYFLSQLDLQLRTGSYRVPFIAILNQGGSRAVENSLHHERGHAYVSLERSALAATNNGEWLTYDLGTDPWRAAQAEILEGRWKALKTEGIPAEVIAESPEWKAIYECQLALGQGEIIARLFQDQPLDHNTIGLFQRNGNYDIVKEFPFRDVEVGDFLWGTYIKDLKQAIDSTSLIDNAYRTFKLTHKQAVLPWILMRLPLDKWRSNLSNAGLLSEGQWLVKIYQASQAGDNGVSIGNIIQRGLRRKSQPSELFERHQKALRHIRGDSLILPEIQRMWNDLAPHLKSPTSY
jgi:hypothetical protein